MVLGEFFLVLLQEFNSNHFCIEMNLKQQTRNHPVDMIYPKDSYFTLKFYYNELVKKTNEKIILTKNAEPLTLKYEHI